MDDFAVHENASATSNKNNYSDSNGMCLSWIMKSAELYIYIYTSYDSPFVTTTKLYVGPLHNNHIYVIVKLL